MCQECLPSESLLADISQIAEKSREKYGGKQEETTKKAFAEGSRILMQNTVC